MISLSSGGSTAPPGRSGAEIAPRSRRVTRRDEPGAISACISACISAQERVPRRRRVDRLRGHQPRDTARVGAARRGAACAGDARARSRDCFSRADGAHRPVLLALVAPGRHRVATEVARVSIRAEARQTRASSVVHHRVPTSSSILYTCRKRTHRTMCDQLITGHSTAITADTARTMAMVIELNSIVRLIINPSARRCPWRAS